MSGRIVAGGRAERGVGIGAGIGRGDARRGRPSWVPGWCGEALRAVVAGALVTLALAYGVAPEARAVESTVLASWGIEDEASTVRVLEAGAPAGGASSARSTPKPVLAAEPALPAEGAAGNLPAGNRSRGIKIFKQCQTCHSVRPGEHNSFGPNLHGVIGRQAAAVEGYPYSEALRKAGFAWTIERLDAYLADPRGYLPGARMLFKGLKDPQDRADVLAYIEAASRRK